MNIYYDSVFQTWYHTAKTKQLYIGGKQTEIAYCEQARTMPEHSFHIKKWRKSRGIAVGMLTCRTDKNEFGIGGNLSLFQELHLYLAKHGIFSYIFTLEDAKDEDFSGFIFSSELAKWIKVAVPFPDVVYNRIPFRSHEASSGFRQLKSLLNRYSIPLFNPRFVHKYEIYEAFKEDDYLRKLLPKTILLSSSTVLYSFLDRHRTVYVKPVTGNRGSGIYILRLNEDETLEAITPGKQKEFSSFTSFWEQESKKLLRNRYIIQKAIVPKKIDGHRYDYRLLVHFKKGGYRLSGKAVRMSQNQEITTHIPRGGKLIPYETVQTEEMDDLLNKIAEKSGLVLSNTFGLFGEFSIDLGEDENGMLHLFEINSKPMQFDEEIIERQRRQNLKNLFIELAMPAKHM
ncbi:hypothetical protein ELQ35_06160 [Peribacillus cavernae]|uniref:ATP-grasp domain-containing protein n=1 Tax=Peribacillus cavernae TaxID=1674310 RepID=A0A433HNN2_9BACI|nr:YheC/YheD family protein [Peribacillus cavernae]MDQ0217632.1 glutathione synthase/RimK-type ligase-like ATP-grasp enzyme [Peribacillus cavernae]RUQ29939.1 hypothetical protein ELQ35_06160 [Peribacillus cavernae]